MGYKEAVVKEIVDIANSKAEKLRTSGKVVGAVLGSKFLDAIGFGWADCDTLECCGPEDYFDYYTSDLLLAVRFVAMDYDPDMYLDTNKVDKEYKYILLFDGLRLNVYARDLDSEYVSVFHDKIGKDSAEEKLNSVINAMQNGTDTARVTIIKSIEEVSDNELIDLMINSCADIASFISDVCSISVGGVQLKRSLEALRDNAGKQVAPADETASESEAASASGNNGMSAGEEDAYKLKIMELSNDLAEAKKTIEDLQEERKELLSKIDNLDGADLRKAKDMLDCIEDGEGVSKGYVAVINEELVQRETLESFVGTVLQILYREKLNEASDFIFDGERFNIIRSENNVADMYLNGTAYRVDLEGSAEADVMNKLRVIFSNFEDLVFLCKSVGKDKVAAEEASTSEEFDIAGEENELDSNGVAEEPVDEEDDFDIVEEGDDEASEGSYEENEGSYDAEDEGGIEDLDFLGENKEAKDLEGLLEESEVSDNGYTDNGDGLDSNIGDTVDGIHQIDDSVDSVSDMEGGYEGSNEDAGYQDTYSDENAEYGIEGGIEESSEVEAEEAEAGAEEGFVEKNVDNTSAWSDVSESSNFSGSFDAVESEQVVSEESDEESYDMNGESETEDTEDIEGLEDFDYEEDADESYSDDYYVMLPVEDMIGLRDSSSGAFSEIKSFDYVAFRNNGVMNECYDITVSGQITDNNEILARCIDAIIAHVLMYGRSNAMRELKKIDLSSTCDLFLPASSSTSYLPKVANTKFVVGNVSSIYDIITGIEAVCTNMNIEMTDIHVGMEVTVGNVDETVEEWFVDRKCITDIIDGYFTDYPTNTEPSIVPSIIRANMYSCISVTRGSLSQVQSRIIQSVSEIKTKTSRVQIASIDDVVDIIQDYVFTGLETGKINSANVIGKVIGRNTLIISDDPSKVSEPIAVTSVDGLKLYVCCDLTEYEKLHAIIRTYTTVFKDSNLIVKVQVDNTALDYYTNRFNTSDPVFALATFSFTEYVRSLMNEINSKK